MPRKRRRLKSKRQVGLTPAREFELLSGHPGRFVLSDFERPQRGEQIRTEADAWADRRADWFEFRETLLAKWIIEHPGSRPAGWWWFEAPGPRRKVSGAGQTLSAPKYTVEAGSPSIAADGTPAWHSGYGFGLDHKDPQFESQDKYLTRRRLWQLGERTAFTTMQKEQRNAAVSS